MQNQLFPGATWIKVILLNVYDTMEQFKIKFVDLLQYQRKMLTLNIHNSSQFTYLQYDNILFCISTPQFV